MEKRAGKNEVKKKRKMELSMPVKLKLRGGLARNSSLALWSILRQLRFLDVQSTQPLEAMDSATLERIVQWEEASKKNKKPIASPVNTTCLFSTQLLENNHG